MNHYLEEFKKVTTSSKNKISANDIMKLSNQDKITN